MSNLTRIRYSISSNFKNLSVNWEKYVFYWENEILNPLEVLRIPQNFWPYEGPPGACLKKPMWRIFWMRLHWE